MTKNQTATDHTRRSLLAQITVLRETRNYADEIEAGRLTRIIERKLAELDQFDADTTASDYVLPLLPDHEQRTNGMGRQVCCETCHNCGTRCVRVLDGELWCPICGAYR